MRVKCATQRRKSAKMQTMSEEWHRDRIASGEGFLYQGALRAKYLLPQKAARSEKANKEKPSQA